MSFLLATVLLAPPAQRPLPPVPKTEAELTERLEAVVKESRPAAEKGLARLAELVTDENCKAMGFASPDDVKAATLGTPFPEVVVRLDELKGFAEGADPLALLHPVHRAVYPVLVNGEVHSGVAVRGADGKWEAMSFGLANAVRRYAEARQKHAGDGRTGYFLLKVPALNEVYLGHPAEKGLRLLHVNPEALQGRLEAKPAAEALLQLVPRAKAHNGESR